MPKLYVLGAGTPTPTPSRFGSAFVLDIDGEKIMLDCGPAANTQAGQGWTLADRHRPPLLYPPPL